MRFLHCSDIHLGRKPVGAALGEFSRKRFEDYFAAFSAIVDKAIELRVDAALIAGDFFDKKELTPDVLARTEIMLERLRENRIVAILIEGNHDNVKAGSEQDSWIVYLESKGLVRRPSCRFESSEYKFEKLTLGDVDFYGLGYPGSMVNETIDALAKHLELSDGRKNVVLVHTAIGSDEFMPGLCSEESLDKLRGLAIYVAAGHFHHFTTYPQSDPFFFIPGSPEYWDFGEAGQTKGVIVFDTDSNKFEFIEANPRKTLKLTLDIESDNYNSFKEEFSGLTSEILLNHGEDVVVLILKLKKAFFVDTAWCEEVLKSLGALKSFIRIVYPTDRQYGTGSDEIKGVEQIERELIEGWKYFSLAADSTANALNKLKTFQKENRQEDFISNFDSLLNRVLAREAASEN